MKANPQIKIAITTQNNCDYDFACRDNPDFCKTQSYFDRDVELLRCDEERNCKYKSYMLGMVICTCPEKARLN